MDEEQIEKTAVEIHNIMLKDELILNPFSWAFCVTEYEKAIYREVAKWPLEKIQRH